MREGVLTDEGRSNDIAELCTSWYEYASTEPRFSHKSFIFQRLITKLEMPLIESS